ncbi:agamous-like MADS-box protein MADS9 [Hibiscus syriacus]|uniref:agamous-like MADS-box protein MADS9 n=1 Tax=Hibiscus syriacus TaxID=106335 RepID=UPI0019213C3C|nr:agamous-like MADS-box protein MADS9 [Hibiscus syriacus]
MGRGKIEIKRIENSSNRQVTYSKRRNGIMKKAKEITVLCDAKVSLIIFASSGKMHEYCSPSTELISILDEYQRASGKKLWDFFFVINKNSLQNLSNEVDGIKKENDNMQIELRHLKGEDITSLPYNELMALEDALETCLTCVRAKQMDVIDMERKNMKFLEGDNKQLNFIMNQHQTSNHTRLQMDHQGYHRAARAAADYNSQMPFAFRVQPMQPNLQGS